MRWHFSIMFKMSDRYNSYRTISTIPKSISFESIRQNAWPFYKGAVQARFIQGWRSVFRGRRWNRKWPHQCGNGFIQLEKKHSFSQMTVLLLSKTYPTILHSLPRSMASSRRVTTRKMPTISPWSRFASRAFSRAFAKRKRPNGTAVHWSRCWPRVCNTVFVQLQRRTLIRLMRKLLPTLYRACF